MLVIYVYIIMYCSFIKIIHRNVMRDNIFSWHKIIDTVYKESMGYHLWY